MPSRKKKSRGKCIYRPRNTRRVVKKNGRWVASPKSKYGVCTRSSSKKVKRQNSKCKVNIKNKSERFCYQKKYSKKK